MARKFKDGDRVRVVKSVGTYSECGKAWVGKTGEIIRYRPGKEYPYVIFCETGGELGFKAVELEAVSKKKAKKKGK